MIRIYQNITALSFFLVFCTSLSAQEFQIGLGGGFGTFKMNSAKEFNQTVLELLPFKAEITEDFPPYIYYKAEALYCFPKIFALGLSISTTSTGSRISLSDYSGKYTSDNVQKGIFAGLKILAGKTDLKKNAFYFALEGGANLSFLSITESLSVYDELEENTTKGRANGFYVLPGLEYHRKLFPKLKISGNLSYFRGFEKGYHLPNNKKSKLYNTSNNEILNPGWNGIRVSLSVCYVLLK